MQEYTSKEALAEEIKKTATLFIGEFDDVADKDSDLRLEGVDRTPREMIAYQLGWLGLIRGWDSDELAGKEVITPAPGYKWNQMGTIYEGFYASYNTQSLSELKQMYQEAVSDLLNWLQGFSADELFQSGGRKWAQSTPSNWPIWKWVTSTQQHPLRHSGAKFASGKSYAQNYDMTIFLD